MKNQKKQHHESKSGGTHHPHETFADEKKLAASALHLTAHAVHSKDPEERREEQVEEGLKAIYDGKPSKEWLNTMEKGERSRWKIVVWSIVGLLGLVSALAWAGFWWFGPRGFSGTGLDIRIEGSPQIVIGKEVTYFINWSNVAKEPLASTEFRVSFPNDFILTATEPKPNQEPLVFRLGSQSAEARGTIKITGRFTGALGTKSAIQVIGTYKPASFNSNFETLVTKELEYADTVLEGSLAVPAKALPGDDIVLRYEIRNKGSDSLEGLEVRMYLPEGFVPSASSSNDVLDGSLLRRSIGSLAPNATVVMEVPGAFAFGSSGDTPVRAEAGTVTENDSFAPAQKAEATISVLAGDLSVNLIVNGSDADRAVALGEWQRIAISYQNISGAHLKGVRLTFRAETDGEGGKSLIDWEKLQDAAGGVRKNNSLEFTEDAIDGLADIAPDGEGLIDLSVPIAASLGNQNEAPIRVFVEAFIAKVDDEKVDRTISTKPVTLTLQTDAELLSAAAYTAEEGIAIGSGPLPPVVGAVTSYRIFWTIQKTLHGIERIKVSATLPRNVEWMSVKEVEAGDVSYDPELRLVTWSVNKMPTSVGSVLVAFDVALTPSEADVGRFAKLLGESRFEFTDTDIGESMIRTAPALTTDLPGDALAKGKGVVSRP